MTRSINQPTKRVAGREGKKSAQGKTPAKLLVAMTGKASAAKTATVLKLNDNVPFRTF